MTHSTTASPVRFELSITGRVQGVGYRYHARQTAIRFGLSGWVRNGGDGSVRAEAQGAAADVECFVAWCRHGPPAARVVAVDVRRLVLDDDGGEFRILR